MLLFDSLSPRFSSIYLLLAPRSLLPSVERQLGSLDDFLAYAREYVKTLCAFASPRLYLPQRLKPPPSRSRGKSIRTDDWKAHLYEYWGDSKNGGGEEKLKILDSVDWDVRTLPFVAGFCILSLDLRSDDVERNRPGSMVKAYPSRLSPNTILHSQSQRISLRSAGSTRLVSRTQRSYLRAGT